MFQKNLKKAKYGFLYHSRALPYSAFLFFLFWWGNDVFFVQFRLHVLLELLEYLPGRVADDGGPEALGHGEWQHGVHQGHHVHGVVVIFVVHLVIVALGGAEAVGDLAQLDADARPVGFAGGPAARRRLRLLTQRLAHLGQHVQAQAEFGKFDPIFPVFLVRGSFIVGLLGTGELLLGRHAAVFLKRRWPSPFGARPIRPGGLRGTALLVFGCGQRVCRRHGIRLQAVFFVDHVWKLEGDGGCWSVRRLPEQRGRLGWSVAVMCGWF